MCWKTTARVAVLGYFACIAGQAVAAEKNPPSLGGEDAANRAARGFKNLTEKAYLPSDFDQETFDQIWQVWPKPLRKLAEAATAEERRKMAYARYGLTERPNTERPNTERPNAEGGDESDKPLQYVVDADGSWTMNCFSCHGGTVYGNPFPGAPNSQFALQTLTDEIRATKFKTGKPLTRMDLGSLIMPLGSTVGRTNAVMFGVGLMHFRKPDLSIDRSVGPPEMTHHDMDAPPWWHFHKRPYLYIDGFAKKGHRGLMQFMLVEENGPEKFRQWESDFKDVYAYLMSLRPPKYEGHINQELATEGRQLFNDTCARCHGTYGEDGEYPNLMVDIDEVGTDRVRLDALPIVGREKYAASWFAQDADGALQNTVVDPPGYVAPPLDGVWASPPYFHNGSVPTLWHVLNPDDRPEVWRRSDVAMNHEKVGFQIEVVKRVPWEEPDAAVRREYMDTRRFGKSASGHDFGLELEPDERIAVLEYLKTL